MVCLTPRLLAKMFPSNTTYPYLRPVVMTTSFLQMLRYFASAKICLKRHLLPRQKVFWTKPLIVGAVFFFLQVRYQPDPAIVLRNTSAASVLPYVVLPCTMTFHCHIVCHPRSIKVVYRLVLSQYSVKTVTNRIACHNSCSQISKE